MEPTQPLTKTGQKNDKAVAALVLGIAGLIIPFIGIICAILAIVFGIQGVKKSDVSGKRSMAITGIVLGAFGVLVAPLFLLSTIGALAYFGALSPKEFLPERCMFGMELECGRFVYMNGEVSAELTNNLPYTIYVSDVQVMDDRGSYTSCSGWTPLTVNKGDTLDLACSVGAKDKGEIEKYEFRVTYNEGSTVDEVFSTYVFGAVTVR